MNAGFKIKRRDDLVPPAVDLKFRISGNWGGVQYTQVIHDVAATIGGTVYEGIGMTGALQTVQTFATGSPAYVGGALNSSLMQELEAAGCDFGAVSLTIDMQGANMQLETCTFATLPVNAGSPNATTNPSGYVAARAFWTALFPDLADWSTDLDLDSTYTLTAVDDNGNPVNLSTYQYLLTRGQVAPWIQAGNTSGGAALASLNVHFAVSFKGTKNLNISGTAAPGSRATQHLKKNTATLCTVPGGIYQNQNITFAGEIIPYGLAGYIYNIAKMVQFEGSFTVQETEITDVCPMGNNLNITGGLAEWSTMNAMVQQISYDLVTGRTTLTFGPAAHLGAKDMVERLRSNRGPRWYNLNGNNLANTGNTNTTQLGSDVAKADPAHSVKADSLIIHPSSLADYAANLSSYNAGVPGINIDSRTSGQPPYGGIGYPNAAVIHLAAGSAGNTTMFVQIDAAGNLIIANGKYPGGGSNNASTWQIQLRASDIPSGFTGTIKLNEWQVCGGFALFLSSQIYASALTESPL